jgi:hypothetical protein
MVAVREEIGPISFFSHASLGAGWYIAWRLAVFTAPFWAGPGAVAAALIYVFPERPELALLAAALLVLGLIASFVTSVRLTTRIAAGWALRRWGRTFTQGVWWGIFWRVAVVGFVTSIITGAVQAGAAVYAAVKPWSPEVLFVTMIPYAVMLVSLVVTLRSYGWAMSTMAARRVAGTAAASPPAPGPAPAPALRAAPLPAPRPPVTAAPQAAIPTAMAAPPAASAAVATAPDDRMQCPKCGLRETERGTVIGWHCKVCGWREGR